MCENIKKMGTELKNLQIKKENFRLEKIWRLLNENENRYFHSFEYLF